MASADGYPGHGRRKRRRASLCQCAVQCACAAASSTISTRFRSGTLLRPCKQLQPRCLPAQPGICSKTLPATQNFGELLGDVSTTRVTRSLHASCLEYLPITFGRRHGDPSRPWNHVRDQTQDEHGNPLLVLRGQLARHFPELGGAGVQLPGVHREASSRSLSMPRRWMATTPIASPRKASTGKLKSLMIPGATSATGVITRSSICRSCWSYREHFHPTRLGELLHRTDLLLRQCALPDKAVRGAAGKPEEHRRLRRVRSRAHRAARRRAWAPTASWFSMTAATSTRSRCWKNCWYRCSQARQPGHRRRYLDEHAAPGMERRQQRAGRHRACRWSRCTTCVAMFVSFRNSWTATAGRANCPSKSVEWLGETADALSA